jgi:flagellar basal body P-ring formation protein FlgA
MMTRRPASIATLLSPPLRGRAGEGGIKNSGACSSPPSPTVPRKGGGKIGSAPRRLRSFLLATAIFALATTPAWTEGAGDGAVMPTLRASVSVTSEVVRVGDLVDNSGASAQVPVYRSPDLGATGVLPAAQVIAVLRQHDVIGVDARDVKNVTVTRLARTITAKDIQSAVAEALAHHGNLGEAANISLTFDRDLQDTRLDASNSGAIDASAARYEARSGRFDVTLSIGNDDGAASTELRFTGSAIETVDAVILTRNVERTDVLRSSDVIVERRAKAEVGGDPAVREGAIGMQMRHAMRAGQPLRVADLAKPDLVQRDQTVTLIYQTAGIYLTTRGKALDNGAEGDVVSVVNAQSKRTVSGVVSGRGLVTIQIATPKPVVVSDTAAIANDEPTATASLAAPAADSPVTSKQE